MFLFGILPAHLGGALRTLTSFGGGNAYFACCIRAPRPSSFPQRCSCVFSPMAKIRLLRTQSRRKRRNLTRRRGLEKNRGELNGNAKLHRSGLGLFERNALYRLRRLDKTKFEPVGSSGVRRDRRQQPVTPKCYGFGSRSRSHRFHCAGSW